MLNNLFSKFLATLRLTDTGITYNGILWCVRIYFQRGDFFFLELTDKNNKPVQELSISETITKLLKLAFERGGDKKKLFADKKCIFPSMDEVTCEQAIAINNHKW